MFTSKDNIIQDNTEGEEIAMGLEGEEAVVVDDLSNFREQWKKELGGKSGNASEESSQERELQEKVEDQEDDIHVKV